MRLIVVLFCLMFISISGPAQPQVQKFRRLPVEVYRQKMTAGWLGQMIGVSLGAPTEFQYMGRIMPDDPELRPARADAVLLGRGVADWGIGLPGGFVTAKRDSCF